MSTGVKKPPVAPKPKVIQQQKPIPPPIAPKPDIVLSHSSPAVTKKAKPAVAPKPCLPKSTASPESRPLTLKGIVLTCAQESTDTSENLGLLNSKNGMKTQLKSDSDYIIRTCSCGQDGCVQCERVGNCKSTGTTIDQLDKQWETCQNGGMEGYITPSSPVPRIQNEPENGQDKVGNKSQVLSASFLEQKLKDVWVQAVSPNTYHLKHKPQGKPIVPSKSGIPDQNLNDTVEPNVKQMFPEKSWSDCNVKPSIDKVEDLSGHVENASERDADSEQMHHRVLVPAAPQKPLPIPMPRKPRKSALLRQAGVDISSLEIKEPTEMVQGVTNEKSAPCDSPCLSSKVLVHTQCVSYSKNSGDDHKHSSPSLESAVLEDLKRPIPPPRRASLTPELDRASGFFLHGNYTQDEGGDHHWGGGFMDEVGDCGDFPPYPITRSLPKKLKLSCNLPSSVAAKVSSSTEEESSPKVAPKKPQRHSLPASVLLKKELSDEAEESGTNYEDRIYEEAPAEEEESDDTPKADEGEMRELPAPPTEKTIWRFPRHMVPFFIKQASRGSSTEPQRKALAFRLGKQRAKSFSSADLDRSDGQKRSSFRKILELKLSVKMLPKLLAKGSHSLDCTSIETEQSMDEDCNGAAQDQDRTRPRERKLSCPQIAAEPDVHRDECQSGAEYENLPFYEEIPEYMNLPFLSAAGALGGSHACFTWQNSSSIEGDDEDGDIYEIQEPYEPREKFAACKRASLEEDDGRSEEEEVPGSSDEDDDDSSASSKGEAESPGDQQNEIGAKKTKVAFIAKEIMSSEKVFVDVLKLLHIDFRDAVAKASRQSSKPVIEERILNQILYYLPQLYELNRDLLRELEERVAHWNDQQQLADIFVKKGPYLKMYSTYIREFDKNVALLDEQCRKNPGFGAVVREFEMSPRCASLALKHYLLKPVQRIPQYQLLLTDYLKNLPEDSSDYKDTKAALGIVKEVANHANDIMKQGDNFQKLMQVQYSLNGHHEIVQPGRVFLKEGTLMKLSRKVMQPRMFFLFNDTLLYTTPVQSGQYKLNCMLSLAGMKVSKPSQEAYQNELNIESVERSFILSASSATERDEWLEAISKAINDHTRKKITFISSKSLEEADGAGLDTGAPLGSKAPIWIPDLRATMCMICTCEFTLTWRRHHCRACGKVVCQTCSSNKHYLEYLKNRPARVCDHCFAKLQKKSDLATPTAVSPSGKSSSGGFSSVLNSIPSRKQKKIPAALKEVSLMPTSSPPACSPTRRREIQRLIPRSPACSSGVRKHGELLHERLPAEVKGQQEAGEAAVVCHQEQSAVHVRGQRGCGGPGEPAPAWLLLAGGARGTRPEAAVQTLPQEHALLHLQGG
nr:FYVE, RhoGEF and PH domain-containing protein 6 isoform X2 [Paramormyrops kingsleyae]